MIKPQLFSFLFTPLLFTKAHFRAISSFQPRQWISNQRPFFRMLILDLKETSRLTSWGCLSSCLLLSIGKLKSLLTKLSCSNIRRFLSPKRQKERQGNLSDYVSEMSYLDEHSADLLIFKEGKRLDPIHFLNIFAKKRQLFALSFWIIKGNTLRVLKISQKNRYLVRNIVVLIDELSLIFDKVDPPPFCWHQKFSALWCLEKKMVLLRQINERNWSKSRANGPSTICLELTVGIKSVDQSIIENKKITLHHSIERYLLE